jgi:hypothetical protein
VWHSVVGPLSDFHECPAVSSFILTIDDDKGAAFKPSFEQRLDSPTVLWEIEV